MGSQIQFRGNKYEHKMSIEQVIFKRNLQLNIGTLFFSEV